MYLLGIDVGTTGCKAIVFDSDGKQVAGGYKEYELLYPEEGWMELDPSQVLACVYSCIKNCTSACDGKKIAAVSVSSQGEAVIPVGKDGKPLSNSIVSFDNRNIAETGWFRERFDKNRIMKIAGTPIHTMFTVTKLLWIKAHMPDVFERTWKFMCFSDFVAFSLGARPVMDYSLASRTMAFDINTKQWSDEILDICGIGKNMLPETAPSGTCIGKTSHGISEMLDISEEAVIVTGGHDQVCCAFGAGVLANGTAMLSMGTTESLLSINEKSIITPEMVEMNIPCGAFAVDGLYAYHSFLSSAGSILKWFRDKLKQSDDPDFYTNMDEEVLSNYGDATGIYVLPHFAGSGTPYLDFNSKGIIAGLTLNTDHHQIYKAILEGICMEARINIENMEKCGMRIDELRCIGGGANSPLWLQLTADITNKKVVSMRVEQAGCLGAAMLAGLGAGIYTNAQVAAARIVRPGKIYYPEREMTEEYNTHFTKYKFIYLISKKCFKPVDA